jgi:cobalamin biosynthesis Mg chelatase CobN
MKKILSLVIVLSVMFTTVVVPAFAVTSGSVAGVTTPTVTVSPTPTKAGEVKGAEDVQTTSEETKDTNQEQSWFAKYWLVILGLLAVIVVGGFVFFGKK